MRKNTKAILVLLCALVMVLTGIGMPVASAATTLDGLTVDYIFDSLGESLQYGVVAHRWEQDAHSETSACVDELYKIAGEEFSNSDITYHYALDYKLKADISVPADGSRDLSGMSFALYTYDGEKYVRCQDTKIDVTEPVREITLEWTISGDLRNERLFVFQTADTADGNGYVPNGATNGAYVVTYGPSISASAQNEIYLGKIILPGKKNQNDAINIFQAPFTHGPSLVLGSDVQLYYSFTENEGDLTPLKLDEIPESEKDVSVYVDYYYYADPQNPASSELLKAQMKLEDVKIRDGEILLVDKDGTACAAEITQESRGTDYVASTLLKDAKDFSVEMGNMGGGEISDKSIPPKGPSTVTSTLSTENGSFISLYDVEIGEDGVFCVKDDMGWKDVRVDSNNQVGIPIQENEYVVINLICPADPDSVVYMAGKNGGSGNITYFYEEGQKTGEQAEWDRSMQTHDSGVSQRVIYNFVYVDENGLMQPYQGTVVPHSCHGGTLLVPEGRVELQQEVHNGSIIANEVYNKQEIHQRTMATQGRSTWVVMDGGYLTLQKASLGYNWNAGQYGQWEDQSNKEGISLADAVFGIYSDEDCDEDSLVATMTTDAEGKATSELISAGTYWVKEITPPKDHNLSDKVIEVKVVAGTEPTQVVGGGYLVENGGHWEGYGPNRVWVPDYDEVIAEEKFVNQQNNGYTSLRLVKTDEFGNLLPGAEFGVFTTPVYERTYYYPYYVLVDCENQIGTAKTNRNGVAVFEDVPLRQSEVTYYIKETEAPAGYEKSETIVTVTLDKDEHRDKLVTIDADYSDEDMDPFVNQTIRGNIALKKVDAANGEPLEGAVFTVYDDPACGEDNIVGTMTTDENGIATSVGIDKESKKDLLPGTYYVVETKAPDGYKAPTDKNNWNQDVPRVYTVTVQYGKTVDVLSGEVLEEGDEPTAITNEQVISITGVKYWHDKGFENTRNNLDANQLAVNLYKKTATGLSDVIATHKITKDDGCPFEFKDLPRFEDDGTEIEYVVKEFLGYGNVPYYSFVTPEVDAETGNIQVTIANSIKKTKLTVKKVWEPGYPEGAPMPDSITYLLYERVDGKLVPVLDANGNQMTYIGGRHNNNYEGKFENLPSYNAAGDVADYVIKEAESDDFALIGDPVIEKNKNNQSANEYTYTLTNRLTVPLKGTKTWEDNSNSGNTRPENVELKIFLLDDKAPGGKKEIHLTGKDAVPGVEIIWDKETNPDVWSWKVIGLHKYDDAGNECSYTVEEKLPPRSPYQATVSDDGLNFTNSLLGRIRLYKEDADYNRMDGVVFGLYTDPNCTPESRLPGDHVTEYKMGSREHGKLEIKNIPYGTYYLKEEKTLDGYQLSQKIYKVVVNGDPSDIENGDRQTLNDPNKPWNIVVNVKEGTETQPTSATLDVTKEFELFEDTYVDETFEYTMTFMGAATADGDAKETGYEIVADADKDGVVQVTTTHTGSGKETASFGDIKFTEAGVYTFKVQETADSTKAGYIVYDDTVYTVTYTVTESISELKAERSITCNKEDINPTGLTFNNKHKSVYIGGTKMWMDADKSFRLNIDEGTFSTEYLKLYTLNADGSLTEFTALNINGNDPAKTATLNVYVEGDNGNFSWYYYDLPGFDAAGNELNYVVKEMTVYGYQTFYVNPSKDYSYKPEDDTALYPRPNKTGFQIYNALAKGTLTIEKTVEVQGNVQPDTLPEFQFTITPAEDLTGYHFMDAQGNELTSPVTIAVEKKADGEITGTLPVTILFDSFAGTEKEFTFTVKETGTAPDGWTYDATEQTVTFTVMRNQSAFEPSDSLTISQPVVVAMDSTSGGTASFTNTYKEEEKISITVRKHWPTSLGKNVSEYLFLCTLDADGTPVKLAPQPQVKYTEVQLPEDVEHHYTWYDLPKCDDKGNEIKYVVIEEGLKGYRTEYWDTNNELQNGYATNGSVIVNWDIKTEVSVTKVWENAVPKDISTNLYLGTLDANGKFVELDPQPMESVKDNTDGSQTYTWSDLYMYDADGNEIEYAVIEKDADGYFVEYSGSTSTYAQNRGTIINRVAETDFFFHKWFSVEPEVDEAEIPESFRFIITPGAQYDGVVLMHKSVDDNAAALTKLDANADGEYIIDVQPKLEPDSSDAQWNQYNEDHLVELIFTKAGEYTFTVKELVPDQVEDNWVYDTHSVSFKFTVSETGIVAPANPVADQPMDEGQEAMFYNKLFNDCDLKITKIWENDDAKTRPVKPEEFSKYLTLRYAELYDEKGEEIALDNLEWNTKDVAPEVKVINEDEWGFTYKDLPKYIGGKEVTWSVVEKDIPGYTKDYDFDDEEDDREHWAYDRITNTFEVTSVSVTKEWVGGEYDGTNEPVTLTLYANDTKIDAKPDVSDNVYTWSNLAKYDTDGELIVYTVKETTVPDGYQVTYLNEVGEDAGELVPGDAACDGGTIVNTYYETWGKVEFEGEKVLNGRNMKPGEFTFILTDKDGNELQSVTNAADGSFAFDAIEFTEKDVPYGKTAEFTYYITELAGDLPGVTYDNRQYEITLELVDDKAGNIVVTPIEGSLPEIVFTNTYAAKGTIVLEGTKVLEGRTLAADEFSFELKDANGNVLQTKKNAQDGSIVFDAIEYTEADLSKSPIKYTISEVKGSESGMTYAANVAEVTVTLTDNGDGTIKAEADKTKAEIKFVNTYAVDGKLVLQASKSLSGSTLKDGQFEFTLTGEGENQTVKNNGSAVVFAAIEYDEGDIGKTFTYTVAEKAGNVPGYTYDATKYTVVVKVVAKDGKLMPEYTVDGETGKAMTFKNAYEAKGSVVLEGTKVLEGRTLAADEFSFELKDANGNVLQTKKNAQDGSIVFDKIEYTEADLSKSPIKYTISEVKGSESGMTYAANVAEVTVTLTDNGDGTIKAEADKTKEEIKFVNTYAVDGKLVLQASKSLSGSTLKDGQFEFTLTGEGENQTVKNNGSAVVFAAIEYDEGDIGKTFTYTVAEKAGNAPGYKYDETKYTVVVKVAMKDGKLMPEYTVDGETGKAMTFKNAYEAKGAIELEGTKVLEGRTLAADEFSFELKDANGNVLQTKKNDKDGNIVFDKIEYTEADLSKSPIKYTISEVKGSEIGMIYAANVAEVTVTLTDNGDGTIKAEAEKTKEEIKFVNTYAVDGKLVLQASKSLSGSTLKDGQFKFTLTGEGENQTVENNGSAVVFAAIEYDEGDIGKTFTYTVAEKAGNAPGYKYDETKYTVVVKVAMKDGKLMPEYTVDGGTGKAMTFKNAYEAKGSVVLEGTKVLEGRTLAADEFSFELKDANGNVLQTKKNAQDGSIVFDKIEYTEADLSKSPIKYTISEVKGSESGMTYAANVAEVTVTLTDNGDGTIDAEADLTKEEIKFVNTYEEEVYEAKGSIVLEGVKTLEGRTLKAGEFTFEVKDQAGKVVATGTNDAAGNIVFSEIKYTEKDAGKTFTYKVYEVKGDLPGVTYAETPVTVQVTVTDNGNGTLTAALTKDSPAISFKNTYDADGKVTFKGAKLLLGREFKEGDEFTFELLNDKGDVIDTVTINPTSGTKADFAFKTIEYGLEDAGKTYTYTYRVKEKAGSEDGVIYDDTVYTVTVTVSDAGDGTLKVVASDAADKLNFTNTYLAEGSVLFSGTKTMNGKALEGGDFTFVLTDEAGKEIETVTNDKDGKIVFSAIQYKLEDAGKTFTYKVSEKNDGKKAVAYDETVYTVTVKVEDTGNGHLKVTTSDNATKLNFTNSYAAKAVLTFNAYKTVNGYKPSVDQVYDFVLLCDDGTEMNAQNKDEMITFGTIAYDEDDIGKTYVYTVKETTEGNELLDVDTAIYQVAVTVKDNGDGNLKLETEILKDGKRASGVVFANTATATLTISKNVKGPGPDKAFDLKVTFIGVDGKELEGVYDYDGDVKGTITSGGVIALKDGQSVTIVGLPEGATYTVEENAGPAYTVTVNGKPVAKAEGTLVGHGKLEFINTVEVTTFSVTKVWEGMDLGEITLTLYADGKQITPQPEVTREGNKYTYYNLPKYNEEGEEIVYSAKERGIDGYIRIYNNVEPFQDVTSFVHDGGTIINREVQEEVHELSFKIRKVWTGVEATEEIPAITLVLYCNGEKLDVPTPKPDSEGWYRYYDLPKTVNGQIAVYTVEEVSIPGFTVTYKTASGEIVEEGVNGGEIINAKIPQTSDPATLGLWLAMMGASAVLLTMLQRRRKA